MTSEKILLISPAWIGDAVMMHSLIRWLRHQHPGSTLDVLAGGACAAVIRRMPEVDQVIPSHFAHGAFQWTERRVLGKTLRERAYTHAILTPNSWKSALVPYFAKIPKRTGWRGEWRYGLLNDVRILDKTKYPLMIQRLLALGMPAGQALPDMRAWWPQLSVSPEQIEGTNQALSLAPIQGAPILGLCPGAAYGEAKRWPADYFADVAKQKLSEGWQVWLFGSSADEPVSATIQAQTDHRCVDLTGRTSMGQAIDCLAQTTHVLTNDSGLMHIAAALQKPLSVVYGSSSPTFTPPLSDQAICHQLALDCSPCFQRTCPLKHFQCMKGLTPEQVLVNL